MQYSRQVIVDVLRKAGYFKAADEAMRELPDPVDLDDAVEFGEQRGCNPEALISSMGGSP
ncbi:hypothetical protein [Actinopolymorpha pittospori]|uniref:Uncharacterized protein n=1 Tax=Actinopolymorpha pittospori TaxID=648752 RepID=A0A927MQQ4_9ACTN|nr:hypothetical protein [Actinopolymorpha pittospori]MBE1604349.1 hypothetical protein [Actinopolymorpha pittospori]